MIPKMDVIVYIAPATPPIQKPRRLMMPTVKEAKARVFFGARKYVKW